MKKVWAIGDLHLSFGVPNKQMGVFGSQWVNYAEKIEDHWKSLISPDDLVLIPGDISWAMSVEDARPDLEWIGGMPGTKVMIKGNHDYWWGSLLKIKKILPPSCHLIQNNSFEWHEFSIGGTRLWDVPGLRFEGIIDYKENPQKKASVEVAEKEDLAESERVYQRELSRLETSLKSMKSSAKKRIVMTHYPPVGTTLQETDVSRLLEKYHVDICVFGHLHNVKKGMSLFGELNGIAYHLTACDFLDDFKPLQVF